MEKKEADDVTSTENVVEQESISVFVRPLEVTVPTVHLTSEPSSTPAAEPSSSTDQQPSSSSLAQTKKTVWSTMTSRIETETSVKRWETPIERKEEGTPPGPEDHPNTKQGATREANMIGITPNYKLGEAKPNSEVHLGKSGYLPNEQGDYKVSMRQEDYKQTIIDPKVRSNANMPYSSTTLPDAKRTLADDFPSIHSKRSQVKLEPLEQRRFRSVESRPITTSNYLTESVQRHREMEESRLRQYLKAKEGDANQPWNKPGWPGPKKAADDESLRELEHIRKSIETLQKAAQQPPKTDELDRLSQQANMLEQRSKSGRHSYLGKDSEILKQKPEPVPAIYKQDLSSRDQLESRNSVDTATTKDMDRSGYVTDVSTATWQFSTQSFSPRSVVSMNGAREDILKDDKPRSIMKRRELESREQLLYPSNQNQVVESNRYQRSHSNVVSKPTVTETVQRFEETRRTEEIERRVQRKERRERRSRQHSSSRHGRESWENGYHGERRVASLPRQIQYQQSTRAMNQDEIDQVVKEAYEAADEARRQHYGSRHRSNSLSRQQFLPSSHEQYQRSVTTRRERDQSGGRWEDEQFGSRGGLAHARYGSLSDSLRRGELRYIPNGDVRESHFSNGHAGGQHRMHKSYSTRDVYNGGEYDRRSQSSHRRGSQQMSPFVEFPPTLPRSNYARSERDYRPVSKSRSYADWDDANRAGFGGRDHRYEDDMGRLEAEFRDSLLMPMPRGNMNERDHRTEQIPGGYETYHKDNRAQSGKRIGKDGQPVDFHESTQEYNYKREQELDRRR